MGHRDENGRRLRWTRAQKREANRLRQERDFVSSNDRHSLAAISAPRPRLRSVAILVPQDEDARGRRQELGISGEKDNIDKAVDDHFRNNGGAKRRKISISDAAKSWKIRETQLREGLDRRRDEILGELEDFSDNDLLLGL